MKCKFEKREHQVSNDGGETWITDEIIKGDIIEYDSQDCENSYMERWIPNGYICEENNKYHREVLQYSTNNGLTWYYSSPMVTRKGDFIAYDEQFCDNKWNGYYWVDEYICPIKIVKCDDNTELTKYDVNYKSIVRKGQLSFNFILFDGIIGDCVTSIGDYTFKGQTSLSSVTIPDSVTNIGYYAFYGCTSLGSITIPDSVTSIGIRAFTICTSLTSLTIPDSVTSIGNSAFLNCTGLTSITVEATTPPTLGSNVFAGTNNCPIYVPEESVDAYKAAWRKYADRIQNPTPPTPPIPPSSYKARLVLDDSSIVEIPYGDSFKITRDEVSAYTSTLVSAEILEDVGELAFWNCTSLSSLTIGDNVSIIGKGAFFNCSSLTSVTIPDSVGIIDESAFWACYNLEDITLHDGNGDIGGGAFGGCYSLTNITLPNTIREINKSLFYCCSGLTSINIPSGVTYIGDSAFYRCSGLQSIVIPNGVTSIGEWAFRECSGLTSIDIPDSVVSIDSNTFNGCTSLTSVTIPSGITIIPQSMFERCTSLTSITMPSGVTVISYYAFEAAGLTSITIPSGVTEIRQGAFKYCSGLTSITVEATTPPALGNNVFDNTNDCPIYVPLSSLEKYMTAYRWGDYRTRITYIPIS